ncbi:MAG: 50S ribosomal protein L11 methyltransferase [Ectothiorhodospiraceae bacterium]|nr:50S ribosomal protein L11 methyltransferase [Ectothiorhodospiraceae bacterium]MCH8505550.1 50S ribosomal protein L11 methyltransferase [Ectothiorhodospiraceae bacterium]
MAFLQVVCELEASVCQPAEDVLMEQGAMSVTFQDPGGDPILEPDVGTSPLWQRVTVLALFEPDVDSKALRRVLERELGDAAVSGWRVERLQDKAWERAWMDDFHPMQFGRRLWVCPSNGRVTAADAVVLKLDPGLAFGTGTHPTTALCLRWLDQQQLEGAQVVDYGCGSGILGIAALLLGARHCHGVDNDPQALTASRENAARNGVAQRMALALPDAEPPPADLLVANILSGVLIELAPRLQRLVKPGGRLALSGILEQQADSVIAAYRPAFLLDPPLIDGDWALITGLRADGD